jgi:hypothetical protein
MDIQIRIWEFHAAKVGFSGGLGISGLLVSGEDFTIIKLEIFLTWQPVLMISQIWARLEYHLHSVPRSCAEDEGGPLGAGLQEQASNHLKLLWSKAMVVSVEEKSRH